MRSPWVIAALALVLNLGISFYLFQQTVAEFLATIPETEPFPAEFAGDPQRFSLAVYSTQVGNLVDELRDREAGLDARSRALDAREARLASEQEELRRLQQQVASYRQQLDDYIVLIEEAETRNLKKNARVMTEMAPESVVLIFKELSDDEVVKLLTLFTTETIAAIFEAMIRENDPPVADAQRAARLADKLKKALREEEIRAAQAEGQNAGNT